MSAGSQWRQLKLARMRQVPMCDKCDEIDRKIAHFKDLAGRIFDQQTLNAIAALIAEQEAQKAALHPEQKE
jgi:hypothetical protein